MSVCKHCKSDNSAKNGFVQGKQRYKCKSCLRTYREGDCRERYTNDQRFKVIKMYLEGVGIRSIERLENVGTSLIIQWIGKFSATLRKKLSEATISEDAKEIQILELDEFFSYCQKKTKSTYGLLLIESEIKLLILK